MRENYNNKEWVKELYKQGHSYSYIVEAYDYFLIHNSCRIDSNKFPIYKKGDIIDEDKSVKWNREEVEKRIQARKDEAKRLSREHKELSVLYENQIIKALAKDYDISIEESDIIWNQAYRDGHSSGVFNVLSIYEELVEMYLELMKMYLEKHKGDNK